jgi:outer membrane protein assembly factor BamB
MKWQHSLGVLVFFMISIILVFFPFGHTRVNIKTNLHARQLPGPAPLTDALNIKLIYPTFLGNVERNYYGDSLPDKLTEIFRVNLGSGTTIVNRNEGFEKWSGAGWTGQPLLIEENDTNFIIIGAFDHRLKKINAETGAIVWEYLYDDIIKGTGTLWHNRTASVSGMRYIIMQGSRLGVENTLENKVIPSFRGISLTTGKALWKINIKKTKSYSRDVDGSALIINDTVYIGMENGIFTVFRPDPLDIGLSDGIIQPNIVCEKMLYTDTDKDKHGGNLVTESSPCYLNGHIYITSGSGHVYGYNISTKTIDWDFYTGSDMDGSPVVTADSCIIVTLEKQYIKGPGGVMKLDPRKTPDKAVVWFFPVESKGFAGWEGGVIGSAAVNHRTLLPGYPEIAAFIAIDGNLYVVDQNRTVSGKTVTGPDGRSKYPAPQLLFKYPMGPSISTPIIVKDRLLAVGYKGIYLFSYDKYMKFTLLDSREPGCEATPLAAGGKVFIASRDGNLYCFGKQ